MVYKLKPCPFCGGKRLQINRFSIDCLDCSGSMFGNIKEAAIKGWNTRADNEPILDQLAKEAQDMGFYD